MNCNKVLSPLAPYFLTILRVVTGLLFIAHGTQKVLYFPISDLHPEIFSIFWIAGVLEIIGGSLVVIGLFTRVAAFILSGEMASAYFMVHAPNSFFPSLNGGESAVLFCFIFLYIVFAGPGAFSLDGKGRR